MGLLSRLGNAWSALRGAPAGQNNGGGWSGGPATTDAFGARPAPSPPQLVEAYKSIIYFCTELNANHVSSVQIRLYAASGAKNRPRSACEPRRVSRSLERHARSRPYIPRSAAMAQNLEEITRHPFLDLLTRPDPFGYFDQQSLIGLICRYLDVVGEAYLHPFGVGEFAEELWPLQAQYVSKVTAPGSAIIDRYRYFTETYKFDELIRFNRLSLKNPYAAGYGPTQAAIEYARLEDQFVSIQESILGAGPRPGMVVSPIDAKMPLGVPEAKKLEADLNRKHSRGAAGRVWVQTVPLKTEVVTYPPADLAAIGISEYDLQRTVSCFGQHPAQYTTQTNLANMEATHRFHAENGIEPRCKLIAAKFTHWLQKFDDRLFVAFDPVLREDEKAKADVHHIYLGDAVISPEEVRTEINYGAAPWDVSEPYISNTLNQPTAAAEARDEAAKVAAAGAIAKPAKGGKANAGDDQADDEKRTMQQLGRVLGLMEDALEDRGAFGGHHHARGGTENPPDE